jgi:hypothetical protein
MRLFVVCVVATSLTGCSFATTVHQHVTRSEPSCRWLVASTAADFVAVGVLAAMTGVVAARSDHSDHEVASLAMGSFTTFLSGLDGVDATMRCRREAREQERIAREDAAAQQRAAAHEEAWKLTVEAETAARAGDCAHVAELDPKIAAIDAGMHDVVFACDLGVMRCRGAL